jgi:hypothetical protein
MAKHRIFWEVEKAVAKKPEQTYLVKDAISEAFFAA